MITQKNTEEQVANHLPAVRQAKGDPPRSRCCSNHRSRSSQATAIVECPRLIPLFFPRSDSCQITIQHTLELDGTATTTSIQRKGIKLPISRTIFNKNNDRTPSNWNCDLRHCYVLLLRVMLWWCADTGFLTWQKMSTAIFKFKQRLKFGTGCLEETSEISSHIFLWFGPNLHNCR